MPQNLVNPTSKILDFDLLAIVFLSLARAFKIFYRKIVLFLERFFRYFGKFRVKL